MLLTPRDLPGRGRGLVTTAAVPPGTVVLTDTPFLLAVAADATADVCAACLRAFSAAPHPATPCAGCRSVAFCSPECVAGAASSPCFHTPAACAALAALDVTGLDADTASSARLVVTLAVVAAGARSDDTQAAHAITQFDTLCVPAVTGHAAVAAQLAPRVAAALAAAGLDPLPPDRLTACLAAEAANAFAIVDAAPGGDGQERRVRGCGLYAAAALFNHDCLSSVARCDDFDGRGSDAAATTAHDRTALIFRTLHALPAGEEATLSYVPLGWGRGDRGPRFSEEYGFVCACARCVADAEADGKQAPSSTTPAADPGYVSIYLAKYTCTNCGGSLVPTAPRDDADAVCNVCCRTRTHAEFVAALEGEGDDGSECSE